VAADVSEADDLQALVDDLLPVARDRILLGVVRDLAELVEADDLPSRAATE